MSNNTDRYDKVIRKMLDEPVTLVLTNEEVSRLMELITELTLGPYAPTDEEWKWLENVLDFPPVDYFQEVGKVSGQFYFV